jgi:hypothetical protein
VQQYNKAIAAAVTAVVALLANFSLELTPFWRDFADALVPLASVIAVWYFPNKPATA